MSKKRSKENKIYSQLRKKYLEEHLMCEVCSSKEADQIHHKARRGPYLLDVKYFLAVCFDCHNWIEAHPDASRKAGWMLDKFNADNI